MSQGMTIPTDKLGLRNRRVTVMGLGRFGGGVAVVRFLAAQGAKVTVTDLLDEEQLAEPLSELADIPLPALHLGGHRDEDFVDTDLLVVSPAVSRDSHFLQLAIAAGVPLSSEMNLFWQQNQGRIVGVTGSNGKSTTTALVHSILQAAGKRCWLGGNLGTSLLPVVEEIEPDDWVVLELSSFQLQDLDRLFSSPQVAVVTNFSPNHLDWHGSLEEYRQAKQTLLRWQMDDGIAVLNQDDADVARWSVAGRTMWFGIKDAGRNGVFLHDEEIILRDEGSEQSVSVNDWDHPPGIHNLQNTLAAGCACLGIGVDLDLIQQGLSAFKPLPHRLEFVAEVAGRKFYNDSLATTPESATAALSAFSEPIVLLAGGYDKQVGLRPFKEAISAHAKAVALMGTTAEELDFLLEEREDEPPCSKQICSTFTEAFRWAVQQSEPGDVVLLSPGCASYDWFRNFEERGEVFRQLVSDWQRHCDA